MYGLARPLLFSLSPERAHRLVVGGLKMLGPLARVPAGWAYRGPTSGETVEIAGLTFGNPLGLAAGLDKDGELVQYWPCVGFGFVELGTVTALAQPGNPQPRLFRFPEREALVNRMGFNNHGSEALAKRLRGLRESGWTSPVPVGVNIGKSKVTPLEDAVADYVTSTERLRDVSDYLVVNVSSPNTPGLRSLQDPAHLRGIVAGVVQAADSVPVFVKLAPDLADEGVMESVHVAESEGASGIIATNTTIERHGIPDVGAGGTSGKPLFPRALDVVRLVARESALPVIGVGGIASAEDAAAMIAAGARAVQVYSALVFQGPALVGAIRRGLREGGAAA
ncbi:MAG: quinone-dependent dihydroorotate dehydrogenase [Myxococcota bacterium]